MSGNEKQYSVIKDLYKILIQPLIDVKPDSIDFFEWLEMCWDVENYPLYRAKLISNLPLSNCTLPNGLELVVREGPVYCELDTGAVVHTLPTRDFKRFKYAIKKIC